MHRETASQTMRADADDAEESGREFIKLCSLVSYRKAILLPDTVKERHDAVVEDIEKSPKRRVFVTATFYDELGIMMRKNTERAGKTHEGYRHLRRLLGIFRTVPRDLINLARRKRECLTGAKTNGLAFNVAIESYCLSLRIQTLQQSYCLKEVKAIRLIQKLLR